MHEMLGVVYMYIMYVYHVSYIIYIIYGIHGIHIDIKYAHGIIPISGLKVICWGSDDRDNLTTPSC